MNWIIHWFYGGFILFWYCRCVQLCHRAANIEQVNDRRFVNFWQKILTFWQKILRTIKFVKKNTYRYSRVSSHFWSQKYRNIGIDFEKYRKNILRLVFPFLIRPIVTKFLYYISISYVASSINNYSEKFIVLKRRQFSGKILHHNFESTVTCSRFTVNWPLNDLCYNNNSNKVMLLKLKKTLTWIVGYFLAR